MKRHVALICALGICSILLPGCRRQKMEPTTLPTTMPTTAPATSPATRPSTAPTTRPTQPATQPATDATLGDGETGTVSPTAEHPGRKALPKVF